MRGMMLKSTHVLRRDPTMAVQKPSACLTD